MIHLGDARIALAILLIVQQAFLLWLTRRRRHRRPIHRSGMDILIALWILYVALLVLIARLNNAQWHARNITALALIALGVFIRLWALHAIAGSYFPAIAVYECQELVMHGAYSRLAHPLYAGFCVELIGLGVFAHSGPGYVLVLLGVGATRVQVAREERLLTMTYGKAYTDYRRRVWDFGDCYRR